MFRKLTKTSVENMTSRLVHNFVKGMTDLVCKFCMDKEWVFEMYVDALMLENPCLQLLQTVGLLVMKRLYSFSGCVLVVVEKYKESKFFD